jgi:pimeloyl-ACP methyl ester carboxylesterase
LELLDHLQVTRCIVVGQSLGAVMAAALAQCAPDRIAAVALVSPASGYGVGRGDPLPERISQRLIELQALGSTQFAERRAGSLLSPEASLAAREIVRRAMAEVTPIGYEHAARLLASANLTRDVGNLPMPHIVIWGSMDTITPPEDCRRIATAAKCIGVELDGVGHALATEAPHRFKESIGPMIAAVEKSG